MERDARYAVVALFALAAVAAAVAFVWWYSGQGDRRTYDRYEIHFEGSVSGLAQGSPVRYLGVDVGRVEHLSVSRKDPGRVRVVAEIDSEAPLSGATRARLGLLGLTGLLYIDLQLDPEANAGAPLAQGERYPVIPARKGDIEAFVEKLPDLVGHAGAVMVTHDLDTLARTCDRVAVLVDRKVILDTLEGIVANEHPWIRHYFHGERGRAVTERLESGDGT